MEFDIDVLETAARLEAGAHLAINRVRKAEREAFDDRYGAFWKCRRCGGYIGSRMRGETESPGYVCPYCGSVDNMAHGYSVGESP